MRIEEAAGAGVVAGVTVPVSAGAVDVVTGCSTTVGREDGLRSELARQISHPITPRTTRPMRTMRMTRDDDEFALGELSYRLGELSYRPTDDAGSPGVITSGRLPGDCVAGIAAEGDATGAAATGARPSSSSSLRSELSMSAMSRWYSPARCSVGASAASRASVSRCAR